jgi:hypothetical protein
MPVIVSLKAESLPDIVFPDADGVDVTTSGYLRMYRRGNTGPDTPLGGVTADEWRSYRIQDALDPVVEEPTPPPTEPPVVENPVPSA